MKATIWSKRADWMAVITRHPLENSPSFCQCTDLIAAQSCQCNVTLLKPRGPGAAEGILNTFINSQTDAILSTYENLFLIHLYWQKFVTSYTHPVDTAGGGKHYLIGVLTSCLSIKPTPSSLWYSVHLGPIQYSATFRTTFSFLVCLW